MTTPLTFCSRKILCWSASRQENAKAISPAKTYHNATLP